MIGLLPPEEITKENEGGQGQSPGSFKLLASVRKSAAVGKDVFGQTTQRIFATWPALELQPDMLDAFSAVYRDEFLSRAADVNLASQ